LAHKSVLQKGSVCQPERLWNQPGNEGLTRALRPEQRRPAGAAWRFVNFVSFSFMAEFAAAQAVVCTEQIVIPQPLDRCGFPGDTGA